MISSEKLAEAKLLMKLPITTLESEFDQAVRHHIAKSAKSSAMLPGFATLRTASSRLKLVVDTRLKDGRLKVHQTVCVKLRYCERVHSRGAELIVDLADVTAVWFSGFPIPAIRISAYMVRKKLLNPYCNCPPDAVKKMVPKASGKASR
jgi:hypothetical protein